MSAKIYNYLETAKEKHKLIERIRINYLFVYAITTTVHKLLSSCCSVSDTSYVSAADVRSGVPKAPE